MENRIKVTGRYYKDVDGWKYLVSGKTVYNIGSSVDWGRVSVGEDLPYGGRFTEKMLNQFIERCDSEGTFILWI